MLRRVAVGSVELDECKGCGGLWADTASFQRICAERESQAAVLGAATPRTVPSAAERYFPCPDCGRLMNRFNFAQCSGVLVDLCKSHGVWFDAGELRQIVEFVREGGLDRAREREKQELDRERKQLREGSFPAAAPLFSDSVMTGPALAPLDYHDVVSAARDLLGKLFR